MRGNDDMQEALITVAKLNDFVLTDHPLRPIGALVNEALAKLNDLFNELYSDRGRASVAPKKLLRAFLLQVFFRSAATRKCANSCATTCCFAGLSVWPLSSRCGITRCSPRTGNRSGPVVGAVVTHADGFGERAAAFAMLDALPGERQRTIAADKAYDTADFVAGCQQRNVTPHVASNDTRRGGSAIDGRTTRHEGYRLSQIVRKRIEEHFGWGKTSGRLRQTAFRGIGRVDHHFKLTMTASNLVRIARRPSVGRRGATQ